VRGSKSVFVLLCLGSLIAQDDAVFKTDVKVVNMLAAVRNKHGTYIKDLTRDDFVLSEDGRPQTIRYFTKQSELPLKLGLLVDTSVSQDKVMSAERVAAAHFFDEILRLPQDRVFLVQFDNKILLKQEFTANLGKLEDAMTFVDTPSNAALRDQVGPGTLLYDAVVYAAKDIMASQQGRKAVILLTDGVDTGSEATVASAVEAALKSDTLIYSILFSDAGYYGGFEAPDGKKLLMRMSRETGGGFFEVSKKQSIDRVFGIIEDELRSQYSIGYVSDRPVEVSEFRKIQLTIKQKGFTVQTRERYWARR
jgi:VWFA-related protein